MNLRRCQFVKVKKLKTVTYGDLKLKPYNSVILTLSLNIIGRNTLISENGDAVALS